MNKKDEKQLIAYCLDKMATKEQIAEMLKEKGFTYFKKYEKKEVIMECALEKCKDFNINYLTEKFRSIWKPININTYIKVLKSNELEGHNWHGATPSSLHRRLQDHVRKCAAGEMTLDELFEIGKDIMKHEYFMVAQHDILEYNIIKHFKDSIPSISPKSITDFVFKGVPVDLKVTAFPPKSSKKWKKRALNKKSLTDDEKKQLIIDMYYGADKERKRKEAEDSINDWGNNRMYVVIRNHNIWFEKPESIVEKVISELEKTQEPFNINGLEAFCIEV